MGFIESIGGTLFKALGGATEVITPEQVRQSLISSLGGGLVVPDDNAKSYITNGYETNLVVNTAVQYITKRAAALPLMIERTLPDGEKEYIHDHKLLNLLRNPNELSDYKEFAEQAMGFYLLTGNWFGFMVKSDIFSEDNRLPLEIYTLPTQYTDIQIGGNKVAGNIVKYKLNIISQAEFEPDQVIHWRTPNYDYDNGQWMYGQSPLKAALQTLNVSNSNETAQAKQAQNLGAAGLLMFDHNNKGAIPTSSQLRDIQSSIKSRVMGASNRGRIVATSMMYKWQQLGLSSEDLKLIEQYQLSARQLYAVFGLPSVLFNDTERSTYNNVEQAKKSAYDDAILPTLKGWLAKISAEFLEPDMKLVPDTSKVDVLRKDNTELIRALSIASFLPTSYKQQLVGMTPDYVLEEYPTNTAPEAFTPEEEEERKRAFESYRKFLASKGLDE